MSSEQHLWKLPGSPSNIMRIGKDSLSERAARIGKHKAIVAIARTLLVAVWHVLSRQCADIHGSRTSRRPHTAQLPRTLWHDSRQTTFPGRALALLRGINWDSEQTWKKFTTVVASIASQVRIGKEKRAFEQFCCPFSQASLSLPRCFPMSRPEPYGLLRCASQVLTRLSVRGLGFLSLIQRQKIGWFFVLLTCCTHRCRNSLSRKARSVSDAVESRSRRGDLRFCAECFLRTPPLLMRFFKRLETYLLSAL